MITRTVVVLVMMLALAPSAFAQVSPGDSLSLEDVVREALASNPEIAQARSLWRASEARVPAAGALEDPTLEFMVDQQPFDSGDGMRVLSLTQAIPFPGKRGSMTQEARGEAAASRQMARDMVRRVVTEVKSAYYELFMLENQLAAMRNGRIALSDAVETTRSRYETGTAGQQELLLMQVDLTVLDGEIARDEAMASAARAKLNQLLARDAGAPLGEPHAAGLTPFDARLEDLVAEGRKNRPQVLARESELQAAQASERFARLGGRPDFMLRGGYMRMPGAENAWQAAVGVTLPIWKGRKQNALANEASARVDAARRAVEAERNRAGISIEEEYAKLIGDRELARRYSEDVLPLADAAYRSARAAYVSGTATFPVLLESVRRVTELRRTYFEYLAGAETQLAMLEEAVGVDLGPIQLGPDAGLSGKEGTK